MKKVFFLGPQDSYSHFAAGKVFGNNEIQLIPCESFLKIVNNTISEKKSVGVLPIENSITSDIHENIDFLFKNNLQILHEAFLRINLHLIGLPNSTMRDIKKIYSHPRALAQCTKFIQNNKIITIETPSTSAAKDILLKENDKSLAAIGNKQLALNNKLKIIKENIGDDKFNMTRFIFASAEDLENKSRANNKATIIFRVSHSPGSLAELLTKFAAKNLNLTKIESRPIPGTDWEYQFWIDIESTNADLDINQISSILKNNTQTYKIIGIYEIGKIFES